MNYEEKYKEALKKAKEIKEKIMCSHLSTESCKAVSEYIDTIIPELAESEDERIRKWILEKVQGYASSGIPCSDEIKMADKAIAYLEKQKEVGIQWLKSDNVKNPDKPYIDKAGMFYTTDGRMCYASDIEKQKEQKPAESISQLTVQGKGVYKICPRCKERMVRDDSMVYTSMPPQYRYECPKCGESECDTVMYDNPEMEEQKPNIELIQQSWYMEGYHDREFGKEPKWILKTDKGGPKHELNPKYGQFLQKPAEWSEEDKEALDMCIDAIPKAWKTKSGTLLTDWLKEHLRSSWKPSEEQMKALLNAEGKMRETKFIAIASKLAGLYEDLKKLIGEE